ncbi:MAG: DUF86 domain-containing protein [Bacteroidia bacterium]|jgi:uncharacterized protein with HEPN domain|nr:MAG: DUF86 domain-containing protein [Bacteroidia bacterium]
MKGQLSDKARLHHILDAVQSIEAYVEGISLDEFSSSSEKTFATVKQLEIIGEAANRVSDETKAMGPDIEWSKIIALRNILVHEYYIVDHIIIWDIIQVELPNLKIRIEELLSTFT